MAMLFHPAVAYESRRRGRDWLDEWEARGRPPAHFHQKHPEVTSKAPHSGERRQLRCRSPEPGLWGVGGVLVFETHNHIFKRISHEFQTHFKPFKPRIYCFFDYKHGNFKRISKENNRENLLKYVVLVKSSGRRTRQTCCSVFEARARCGWYPCHYFQMKLIYFYYLI